MNIYHTAKQTPVSMPEICAPRSALMKSFDKGAKGRYLYVHAPAGYGKTISTLLWLKQTNQKTIWISLDEYDSIPILFYRLFCMSILSVIPHDAGLSEGIKAPAFSAAPVESTIDLLSRLDYEDCQYALVLDDFHVIVNEEIKKSLPFVLKRLPVTVTVIVLSRNSAPDSLASFNGQDISCIGTQELTFTSDEIRRHFASYGRFITREEADNIHEYTEGWIIALNTMVIGGTIDLTYQSQSLSLNSFIEMNIWSGLETTFRDFLLKTSIPDKFSLALCEYLTQSETCIETLAHFIGGTICISLVGEEYRYHSLFLGFLRTKLNQSDMDIKALNKRVADFYIKKGDFLTAKRYAVISGDMSAVIQIVRSFYDMTTFSIDEYIEFHKLHHLHMIPDAICDKIPLLYIPRIFFAYTTGDVENTHYLFDRLYPVLPLIAQTQPEIMEHVNSIIMLDCRIKLAEFSSHFVQLPPITQVHKNMQSPTFTFQLPFLHRSVRDFYELDEPAVDQSVTDISSKIIKQNTALMFRGAEAGLLLEKNKLQEALRIVVDLKPTIDERMSPEFVYAFYVLIAEIYLSLRRRDQYESSLKEVRAYISQSSSQYLLKNLSAYEARSAILNGEKAAAEAWLKNYFVGDDSFGAFYEIYRNFTTARAYIVLSWTEKATVVLQQLRALSQSYGRILDTAEADVLLAIVEWISGKKKEAQDRLMGVLLSIQPHGFMRVVANEGKAVLPLLSSVIKKIEKDRGLVDRLYKFAKEIYILSYEQSKHYRGLTQMADITALKLSSRQKYILELLSKGYKNAEIVDICGLSLNTVRTHTKAVYQKLEVNNALDAIVRAKQLGLIE